MPDIKKIEAALELAKDESKVLGLTLGATRITPGQKIPKADAQSPPELSFNVSSGTYLVIGLDIDAPFPSFGVLSPILHWVQPGLKPEKSVDRSTSKLSASFVSDYVGPAPPPTSSPHRYVFLLYEQPEDFDATKHAPTDGTKMARSARMRYDLGAFEKTAKLGAVIAANYFVSN